MFIDFFFSRIESEDVFEMIRFFSE